MDSSGLVIWICLDYHYDLFLHIFKCTVEKNSIDPFYIPVLYSIDIKCDLESLIFLLQMGFHCLNCYCFFNIYDRFHS